jgi:hypothetical protein
MYSVRSKYLPRHTSKERDGKSPNPKRKLPNRTLHRRFLFLLLLPHSSYCYFLSEQKQEEEEKLEKREDRIENSKK